MMGRAGNCAVAMLICFSAVRCSHLGLGDKNQRRPASVQGEVALVDRDVLDRIDPVGSHKVLKFSLLKDANGKFTRFLLQDPKFAFHYEFLSTLPEFQGLSRKEIEDLTYKASPQRRAYIGIVSFEYRWFADIDRPSETSFYVMADDLPPVQVLSDIHGKIVERFGEEYFIPNNFSPLPQQEAAALAQVEEFKRANLNISIGVQGKKAAYSSGWVVGKVIAAATQADVDALVANNGINKNTILLTQEALRELPPCGGVISSVPLTPGSHLSLLAQMYGFPLVYEKDAHKIYAAQVGKTAFLASNLSLPSHFQFTAALTEQEIGILKNAKLIRPFPFDYTPTESKIVEVKNLTKDQVGAYGGKSTKFGLLRRLIPQNTRNVAAGIPVYYYDQFVTQAMVGSITLKKAIDNELKDLSQPTYPQVEAASKKIEDLFKAATVPQSLLESIRTGIFAALSLDPKNEKLVNVRVKLRSSSNVEDGAEFNGAGLYESEGVCIHRCEKDDFAKGLKKVWGSLYSARGMWARQQFAVDNNKVGMGILAHAPFKGEIFNGVIRTSDVYSEVTTQKGEESSVTNAEGAGSSEVLRYSDGEMTISVPFPKLARNSTVMNPQHYKFLHATMLKIKDNWPYPRPGLEIESEWKVMVENGVEKIYLKQVREVPAQSRLNLADKSNGLVITGGGLSLKGRSNDIFDPIVALYRIRDLQIPLPAFTEAQFAAGKIQIGTATATIKNKKIQLKPGKITISKSESGARILIIPFSAEGFENLKVIISWDKSAGELITSQASPMLSVSYTGKVSAFKNNNEANLSEALLPSVRYLDDYTVLEDKPLNVVFRKTEAGSSCSFRIDAVQSLYLHDYDRERIYYTKLQVSGILKRPITLTSSGDIFHQVYVHDGRNKVGLDLFGDPSLTEAERASIDKFGRYVDVGLFPIFVEQGEQSFAKKDEFSILELNFKKSNLSSGKSPVGCPKTYVGYEDGAG